MSSTARRRLPGMTLIEVLAAMTILAIGIAGVMGAISACLRGSNAAAAYARGTLLAQQVAAELERNESLAAGDLSGTFDDASSVGYTWSATVGTASDQGLVPVQIVVLWANGTRSFTLPTTLRPRTLPTAASPAAPAAPPAEGNEPPGPTRPMVPAEVAP